MRFLIDNPLSPKVAAALRDAGHEALHVREISMGDADDDLIFARAAQDDRVLISADTDFVRMLALRSDIKPSVILLRQGVSHKPSRQVELLLANLAAIEAALEGGAIVIFEGARIRVRALPISSP